MPNDNHFWDDLFRQVANEPDIPFREESWIRMERMLEKDRRRFLWIWLPGFLLFAILGMYWFFAPKNGVEPAVNQGTFPIAGAQKTNTLNPAIIPLNPHKDVVPGVKLESSFLQLKKREHVEIGLGLTADPDPIHTASAPLDNAVGVLSDSFAVRIAPASDLQPLNEQETPLVSISMDQSAQPPLLFPPAPMLGPSILQPVFKERPDPLPGKLPIRVHRPARWKIGLELSPSAVSIGFPNPLRAGIGVGAIAAYSLGNRLSISMDLQGDRVFYLAGNGQYKPGYKFWTRKIAPVATEGDCSLIKSTLLGRFNVLSGTKTTCFVLTGVSSWWLLKEQYEYMYTQTDPDLIRYWHSRPDKLQLLGSGGIGCGLERRFGPYWSIQAALYSEIPFTGIGHGHVHMYSTGLSMSILRRL